MTASIWDVLGIAETPDERAIKRAYAARLKVTSPESDPDGYMTLRDAYEAAKNHAEYLRLIADPQVFGAQPAPQAVPIEIPPPTPQHLAFAKLHALLSENKLDEFLKSIEAIQAAQTFATLDEQNDFIGEVALLVENARVEDVHWLGHLAALLGARERDNIFARDSRYWNAYNVLLDCYSEVRNVAAYEHVQTRDEIATAPGYLHVYHVLTAPFDSERLMALTRSQTYHRLAEIILQRSKADPAIVIPAENREWWERTRMAGQHRSTEEREAAPSPPPADRSSGFPIWPIWIVLMLVLNGARSCSSETTHYPRATSEELQRYRDILNPVPSPATDSDLYRRLESCDPQTRMAVMTQIYKVRSGIESTNTPGAANPQALTPPFPFDVAEVDPVVERLLATCKPRIP
jgi:hypothetical protein